MEKYGKDYDAILEFWKDPGNYKSICDAVPLENLTVEELVLDHFEAEPADVKKWILTLHKGYAEKETESPTDFSAVQEKETTQDSALDPSLKDRPIMESATLVKDLSIKDSADSKTVPTDVESISIAISDDLKEIRDNCKLKCFPYNCVGKILWFRPHSLTRMKTEKDVIYYATAFYIGDNKIVTVAHHFDYPLGHSLFDPIGKYDPPFPRKPLKKAIFVPAMIDKFDVYGQNYGFYPMTGMAGFLPDYKARVMSSVQYHLQLDIAIASITHGNRPIDTVLHRSIDLRSRRHGGSDSGIIIGYPQSSENGRMCELPVHIHPRKYRDRYSKATPQAYFGMSGGPWMWIEGYDLSIARGVQSGIDNSYSYSPPITDQILKELRLNERMF